MKNLPVKNLPIVFLIVVLTVFGCGDDKPSPTNNTQSTNNSTQSTNNSTQSTNNSTNNSTQSNNNSTNNSTQSTNNGTTSGEMCIPTTTPGPCDTLCQTGCSELTKCVFDGTSQLCLDKGVVPAGELCDAVGACEAGSVCADGGVCVQYCRADVEESNCPEDKSCERLNGSDDIGVCRVPFECDWVPDTCVESEKCTPLLDGQTLAGSRCNPTTKISSQNDPCDQETDRCGRDFFCTSAQQGMTSGTCKQICRLGNPECLGGTTCQPVNGALSGTDIGICS